MWEFSEPQQRYRDVYSDVEKKINLLQLQYLCVCGQNEIFIAIHANSASPYIVL